MLNIALWQKRKSFPILASQIFDISSQFRFLPSIDKILSFESQVFVLTIRVSKVAKVLRKKPGVSRASIVISRFMPALHALSGYLFIIAFHRGFWESQHCTQLSYRFRCSPRFWGCVFGYNESDLYYCRLSNVLWARKSCGTPSIWGDSNAWTFVNSCLCCEGKDVKKRGELNNNWLPLIKLIDNWTVVLGVVE